MTKRDIARLFAYTEWANHSILETSKTLSPAQLTQNLRDDLSSPLETLVHMLGAEWVSLASWQNAELSRLPNLEGPFQSRGCTLEILQAAWKIIEGERATLLESLSEEGLQTPHPYTNSHGIVFCHPLVEQMQHIVNHATHHRGQLVGYLQSMGVPPPQSDLIHYYRTVELK